MLADKYVPYNDEWKYKIDVLNTLERIADAVAPVKVAPVKEEIATLSMEKTVEEKPKARARKKKGDA